jgi:carbamoyl-phosphate synthase small subunit
MNARKDSGTKLVLKDGSVFYGKPFGFKKSASGEVVFNTGMTGYPESMTDPSYEGQILTLTYPLIGNYGVPLKENNSISKYFESVRIHVKALVISDYSKDYSHWTAGNSLSEWMEKERIPGIYGIDTRALTKKLRKKGTMLGKIVYGNEKTEFYNPDNYNMVESVSIKKPIAYGKGKIKVVLIDCGCKSSIITNFTKNNVNVVMVPWDYNFNKLSYDGIFISNGPGNPKKARETIENLRIAMQKEKPVFGICLGNQLMALAAGGNTKKLKFGHRSQNQPCVEKNTKRCYITSQNHGYVVDSKKLPNAWKEWFFNLNDGTNEGIMHKTKPFFSVQFHPEANPGPADTSFLFKRFIETIKNEKA